MNEDDSSNNSSSYGPATTDIMKEYGQIFLANHISRIKSAVAGGKSVAAALRDNRLPDGSAPCSKQNIHQIMRRMKKESVVTPAAILSNSTEKGRRALAHQEVLRRYWEKQKVGEVGKGKPTGMQQIKEEVEKDLLYPQDRRLAIRDTNTS